MDVNSDNGIYGTAEVIPINIAYPKGIETASRGEIHTGSASILSSVPDGRLKEYACEITDIDHSKKDTNRALTIEITDESLISTTGGIVQGMSGSPIIQDGKLIGAVTHVLVDDPTRGYGVFIENMLAAAG